MKRRSIRRSLLMRCGIGVGVLMCLLATGTYFQVRSGLYEEMDQSVRQAAALLSNQVEYEDGKIIFEWQEGTGESGHLLSSVMFQYWNETTGEITRSPALKSADLPRFLGRNDGQQIREIRMPADGHQARAIGMRVYPFILPEEMEKMRISGNFINPREISHILVVARDTTPVHQVLSRIRWILGSGTFFTLLIGYFLGEWAVRSSLRPIHELAHQVHARTGNPDDQTLKLPGDLPSELTGLVENFEALLGRVAVIRERERDFIRHAAHELRTPIAGLLATTDLALSKPRGASEYAAQLETCGKTAHELTELVKSLTALSRIGKSAPPAKLESIDLAVLIDDCLERFSPAFQHRELRLLRVIPSSPIRALGDPALCRIVLNNLLDNAVSYALVGTEIQIRMESSNGQTKVAISNFSEDFPANLERLFEPLFRHDASRHDSGTHLGIGLTLSLDVTRAMGGSLTVSRVADKRIEFVLGLPSAAA